MPLQKNPVTTRLEILKTIYRLSLQQANKRIKIDPAQIDGCYYGEINYELRFLQQRGLIAYNGNIVSRKFQIELTPEGVQLMDDAYRAFTLDEPEKESLLKEVFSKIKV
ncbi:MAG: hypothetical protein PHE41_05370 [Eubacteriales bacterium]|nr:hypothetical protein [Eubacteriales bacterium]